MKLFASYFILNLLACSALLASIQPAAPLARALVVADLDMPPLSAVALTQCNLLIVFYATLQDGELVKVDFRHHVGLDVTSVLSWGDSALHGAERAEADCIMASESEVIM